MNLLNSFASLFQLKKPLKNGFTSDPDDILKTKKALSTTGHYKIPDHGLTPSPEPSLYEGLKKFQQQNRLKTDGVMNPDGPTAKKLGDTLAGLVPLSKAAVKSPLGQPWWHSPEVPQTTHTEFADNARAVKALAGFTNHGEHPRWLAEDYNEDLMSRLPKDKQDMLNTFNNSNTSLLDGSATSTNMASQGDKSEDEPKGPEKHKEREEKKPEDDKKREPSERCKQLRAEYNKAVAEENRLNRIHRDLLEEEVKLQKENEIILQKQKDEIAGTMIAGVGGQVLKHITPGPRSEAEISLRKNGGNPPGGLTAYGDYKASEKNIKRLSELIPAIEKARNAANTATRKRLSIRDGARDNSPYCEVYGW